MKNNLLIAVRLLLIAALCGAAIAGVNHVTAPIIRRNLDAEALRLYGKLFSNIDSIDEAEELTGYSYVTRKVVVRDSSNAQIGTIYHGSGTNQHGRIELIVGINQNNAIVGVQFVDLKQSPGYLEMARDHAFEVYPNLPLSEAGGIDIFTGATNSSRLIQNIVLEVAEIHGVEIIEEFDPHKTLFPRMTRKENPVSMDDELIVSREIIRRNANRIGYTYKAVISVSNQDFDVYVGINTQNLIVGVTVDDAGDVEFNQDLRDLIEATFKNIALNSLDSVDTSEHAILDEIKPLVEAAIGVHQLGFTPDELTWINETFANVESIDNAYALFHDQVINILTISDDTDVVGYIYRNETSNEFGIIGVLVAIDVNDQIIDIHFELWRQSDGYSDPAYDDANETYPGLDLNDLEGVDVNTGATVSSSSIKTMVEQIKEIHSEVLSASDQDKLESLFSGLDSVTVSRVTTNEVINQLVEIKDDQDQVIGVVYKASIANEFGRMIIYVGLGLDDKVVGIEVIRWGQSEGYSDSAWNDFGVTYPNLDFDDVADVDVNTGATVSSSTIKQMVEAAIAEHRGEMR